MKTLMINGKYLVLTLTIVLILFGTHGSYAQTITASTPQPLTEAILDGSVVTLTLTGKTFERSSFTIRNAVTVSGIVGVTVRTFDVERVSGTKVTVKLTFNGDFDTNGTLTFTVGADAIVGYNGPALTARVPVTAMWESLTASTESPLTEATLHGSVVTLTLRGATYEESSWNIERALTVSGIEDDTVEFDVGIVGDPTGIEIEGIPIENFDLEELGDLAEFDIENVPTLTFDVERLNDQEVVVTLLFSGNFDTDTTLTFTLDAGAISGYNGSALIAEVPVTAVEESLVASTEFPLTEATLQATSPLNVGTPTLSGGISVVTLTLTGRRFTEYSWEIGEALKVSGIDGVTFELWDVARVSDTEITIPLRFSGDFDTDATLTLTIGADAIAGYNKAFTVQVPVTAVEQSDATVSVSPSPILSPAIGEQLTLSLNITNGKNVAGYQATVLFDGSTLDYVKSTNGDYLPADAFFGDPIIVHDWLGDTFFGDYMLSGKVILAATTSGGAANGDGTLATLTFKVLDYKASRVTLSEIYLIDSEGKRWETTIESGEVIEPPAPAEAIFGDINSDGVVNIQDLVIISARFGQTGQNSADLNGDGLVDIVDLVLAAKAFGADAAAPSLNPQILEQLTAANVKGWLNQARQISRTDPTYLRGITVLEQLLMALTPKETALLPNFPNPFNPETWIPYHLSKDAAVTLHIYAMNGILVRTLTLGYQPAGMYQNRSRAAYWDGKNAFGEPVASGVYFYTLTAGDFSATRKMLIRK